MLSYPQEYENIFHLLFESSSEQSIYQKLLPQDLQLVEFMQAWLKDEVIAHTLNRLSISKGIEFNFCNLLGVRQRFLHLRDISPQSHLWQVFDNQLLKVCTTKLNPYYEFSTVIS
ncbi:MAG: hypothetical protein M1G31_32480 [Pseudanabaena sp. Salubria-1]|nr:hypothetical protein [Pseudanabaena sp. Salubria-1]